MMDVVDIVVLFVSFVHIVSNVNADDDGVYVLVAVLQLTRWKMISAADHEDQKPGNSEWPISDKIIDVEVRTRII